MRDLLYVFLGSGLGGVCRFLVGQCFAASGLSTARFPWPTFSVNVVGSLLIGVFCALAARRLISGDVSLLLVVGVCGGFTTFSTFSHATFSLLRTGHQVTALCYVVFSVVLGIVAAYAGWRIAR